MVALVGTNIGAGQRERALRIALTGGAIAFALSEAVGIAAALWPEAWLGLFGHDPLMLETGAAYLRVVGPAYGFFGLGLSLYFASQGAGKLGWPLIGGLLRLLIAVAGGWLVVKASPANWRGPSRFSPSRPGRLRRDDRRRDRLGHLVQALSSGASAAALSGSRVPD